MLPSNNQQTNFSRKRAATNDEEWSIQQMEPKRWYPQTTFMQQEYPQMSHYPTAYGGFDQWNMNMGYGHDFAQMQMEGFFQNPVDSFNHYPEMVPQQQHYNVNIGEGTESKNGTTSMMSHPTTSSTPPLDSVYNTPNTSLGALSDVSTPEIRNGSFQSQQFSSPETSSISSSTDNEQNMKKKDDEVIMTVGGRLAIVGNLTKYKLRAEEIRRRVSAPEYLNSSALNCIFRKAKTKNFTDEMRRLLGTTYGIDLKTCQRQGLTNTVFTPMLEEEARVLATDVDMLTDAYYPKDEVAKSVFNQVLEVKTPAAAAEMMGGSMRTLFRIVNALRKVKPKTSGEDEILSGDEKLDSGMTAYSLRTHGFGVMNQHTWYREIYTIMQKNNGYFQNYQSASIGENNMPPVEQNIGGAHPMVMPVEPVDIQHQIPQQQCEQMFPLFHGPSDHSMNY